MACSIKNDEKFRALWTNGVPTQHIAEIYGVKYPAVNRAAARFGYSARPRGRRLKSDESARQKEQERAHLEKEKEAEANRTETLAGRLSALGIAPRVAVMIAVGLVRAKTYADLEDLARRHKELTLQRLLPLWHEVRT